jgi:hypothetical protein
MSRDTLVAFDADGRDRGVRREAPGVLDRVKHFYCGLHGHDNLMQFERARMFLKCVSCGHETPGWEITEPPPEVIAAHQAEEPARRPALRPHFADVRRIA